MKETVLNFFNSHHWVLVIGIAVVIGGIVLDIARGILSDVLKEKIMSIVPPPGKLKLWWKLGRLPKNEYVRISAAYLLRIRLDNRYLLVKGHRVKKFQPIGGAFQRYPGASEIINKLGVLDDNKIEIDEINRGDLRVRVPALKVISFLKWFDTGKDRETTIEREFREEVIKTEILPANLFEHPRASLLYECQNFHFSSHYRCHEILLHQVYEVHLTDSQKEYLRSTLHHQSPEWIWSTEEAIMHLGYEGNRKLYEVGEHTRLLIAKNNNLFLN